MNDTLQTLLRSALKIGAGALITKGLLDEQNAETAVAAVVALTSIVWGVLHRRKPVLPAIPAREPLIHRV